MAPRNQRRRGRSQSNTTTAQSSLHPNHRSRIQPNRSRRGTNFHPIHNRPAQRGPRLFNSHPDSPIYHRTHPHPTIKATHQGILASAARMTREVAQINATAEDLQRHTDRDCMDWSEHPVIVYVPVPHPPLQQDHTNIINTHLPQHPSAIAPHPVAPIEIITGRSTTLSPEQPMYPFAQQYYNRNTEQHHFSNIAPPNSFDCFAARLCGNGSGNVNVNGGNRGFGPFRDGGKDAAMGGARVENRSAGAAFSFEEGM